MDSGLVKCTAVRPGASLPCRMTPGASGFDLIACLDTPLVLEPGAWALVPTGLVMEIPLGYEGAVRARSGPAFRHGIGLLNGTGTIDSDYRGEVGVLLMNWGRAAFEVRSGDRIAQIVFQATAPLEPAWAAVDGSTIRGAGGFGHTGGFGSDSGPGPLGDSGRRAAAFETDPEAAPPGAESR
jgi:dUTP pyrophosphatase